MTRPFRLGLPWLLPHYAPMNGSHPLVESYLHGNAAVLANDLLEAAPSLPAERAAVAFRLTEQARRLSPEQARLLIKWADIDAQYSIEGQSHTCDALFLHTTPLHLGTHPWVFHFESFTSLFMPFLFTGETAGVDLPGQGCFRLVRDTLEAPGCLRIVSHMRGNLDTLARVFDSPAITAKCHHVPLGVPTPPDARMLEKFDRPGPLRILFTNSLHQDPRSFYLRGGHHLLAAFRQLRESLPDARLSILSSMPTDLGERFTQAHTIGVTWYDKRVDDAALERLLLDHHLFALPAAGLHSFSLLRAFAHGCVPIVSDAPGYEEYTTGVEDSVLTMRGVRELVYRTEPAGWTSERYAPFIRPNDDFVGQLHDKILARASLPALREMAVRNLAHCRTHFDPSRSQAAFNALLPAH